MLVTELVSFWGLPNTPVHLVRARQSVPDVRYEKYNRHHLPDDCRAYWECGDVVECCIKLKTRGRMRW